MYTMVHNYDLVIKNSYVRLSDILHIAHNSVHSIHFNCNNVEVRYANKIVNYFSHFLIKGLSLKHM